ncbi:MAG: hypothetical protein IIY02_03070, partial [Firmicutes bacterium]|nr:hypothetical protein [Bacillota bacterium]
MTKNKLTPEEKQMPKVRLPFWTALLCCVPLLAAVSFYLFLYFHNTATGVGLPSGLHLMPVIYVVPTLIGLFFRRNHLIRFSSEGFVYRDMLRRIHRYTYDDARRIYATKSSGFIKTEDRTFQFSIKSKHGKLLYALLEKNNVRSGHIDREESVTTPIVATTLGLFFLWVYIMCKMDGEIRFATNAILCVALITIIIGCHSFYENFLTSNQPRTRGHYIIDTDGDPVELFWFWNPLFFFGVGFWIFGALTNVIYWIYYILAAGCFLYLIGYALCIRYLYLCPEKIVAKICKNHLLSKDLKAKMPEKYSSYIQNYLPQEKNEKIPTSKEEPNYISFGSFALAFFGILVFQFLFFNTYLHDSRFEQTQTTEVTFTEGYYQDDSSRFGADYLAYDNEGRRFTFQGFDMYGDETTFTEELNGKTCVVLHARANMGDDITVLQCSENNGTVILSEENSRQRHKDIALFRIKINLIAVALLILCGFLTGYFWKPQSKQKKTSKLDPIRKKIYRGNIRKSQYLG